MNNNDFYVEDEQVIIKHKQLFNKKTIIVIMIILIILVLLYILLGNSNSNDKYSLNYNVPNILYMGEPSNISIELNGSNKYIEESLTTLFSESEDIINIPENEFYGKKSSILVIPLSPGEENIVMVSTIGADKYSKELAKETMHITVCPRFDSNLLSEKVITIKKGYTKNLNINFGAQKCSEAVTYQTDNSNILSVTQDGLIRGITTGKTRLIISNGSNNIEVLVNVIK